MIFSEIHRNLLTNNRFSRKLGNVQNNSSEVHQFIIFGIFCKETEVHAILEAVPRVAVSHQVLDEEDVGLRGTLLAEVVDHLYLGSSTLE